MPRTRQERGFGFCRRDVQEDCRVREFQRIRRETAGRRRSTKRLPNQQLGCEIGSPSTCLRPSPGGCAGRGKRAKGHARKVLRCTATDRQRGTGTRDAHEWEVANGQGGHSRGVPELNSDQAGMGTMEGGWNKVTVLVADDAFYGRRAHAGRSSGRRARGSSDRGGEDNEDDEEGDNRAGRAACGGSCFGRNGRRAHAGWRTRLRGRLHSGASPAHPGW